MRISTSLTPSSWFVLLDIVLSIPGVHRLWLQVPWTITIQYLKREEQAPQPHICQDMIQLSMATIQRAMERLGSHLPVHSQTGGEQLIDLQGRYTYANPGGY